ncbi:aminotransferase class I and II domain-containing protein [Phthorimaea operculella]|nr:aminotransferase class I and II domain-containing protein [Phthorimaea operculella]
MMACLFVCRCWPAWRTHSLLTQPTSQYDKYGRGLCPAVDYCTVADKDDGTYLDQIGDVLKKDPQLIDSANFPADVKQRARDLLAACGGGSMGSYSASHGIEMIRRHAAEYIERRDGHPANWADICLSSGASNAIKNVLQLFCNNLGGKPSGVMIPIPQYPLYSASLAEYGLEQVGYYLDEDHQWGLDPNELERSLKEAQKNCNVRALVVINPGNPTGQSRTSLVYLDEDHQWGLDPNELERSLKEAQKNCNVRALVVINPGNPTGQRLYRMLSRTSLVYLDEEHQWGLDPNELERSLKEAQKNCNVRALVVINPGNPTGQVLYYCRD